MRWPIGFMACLILVGCGVNNHHPVSRSYQPAAATALVFDPPISALSGPMFLPRDERTPSAFVGFEQTQTTYYYLHIDDRQTDDASNRYERRAISDTVGVRYR